MIEVTHPKQNHKAADKKPSRSPLERYEHTFCHNCVSGEWCKPNKQRMLICVLTAIQHQLSRTTEDHLDDRL